MDLKNNNFFSNYSSINVYSLSLIIIPISFQHFYKLYKIITLQKPKIEEDPLLTFYNKNKKRFILSFQDEKNYNDNIHPSFYDKEYFQQIMKEENNSIEREWRTRILFENTPRGNIVMFYDPYKQGFSYYCDFNGIPYPILNAVAMKYVILFRCRDLFVDNKITNNFNYSASSSGDNIPIFSSPLIPIFINEEKKDDAKSMKKIIKNNTNMPFAKLKNYSVKVEPIKVKSIFLKGHLLNFIHKSTFIINKIKNYALTNLNIYWSLLPTNIKKQLSFFSVNNIFLSLKENPDNKPIEVCKKEPETEHTYNRFIHLGKVNNFRIIPLTNRTNKFNGFQSNLLTNIASESALQKQITNYKDYKNLINL